MHVLLCRMMFRHWVGYQCCWVVTVCLFVKSLQFVYHCLSCHDGIDKSCSVEVVMVALCSMVYAWHKSSLLCSLVCLEMCHSCLSSLCLWIRRWLSVLDVSKDGPVFLPELLWCSGRWIVCISETSYVDSFTWHVVEIIILFRLADNAFQISLHLFSMKVYPDCA